MFNIGIGHQTHNEYEAIHAMSDQFNRTDLVGALERCCRSGERSLAEGDAATAAVAVEAGRRLQGHPHAMEFVDSLAWHRQRVRLRDLARRLPGPLTSDEREQVPRALTLVLRGETFNFNSLVSVDEGTPEFERLMRRRSIHAVPGDRHP